MALILSPLEGPRPSHRDAFDHYVTHWRGRGKHKETSETRTIRLFAPVVEYLKLIKPVGAQPDDYIPGSAWPNQPMEISRTTFPGCSDCS